MLIQMEISPLYDDRVYGLTWALLLSSFLIGQRQQHFQQGTAGGVVARLDPPTMGEGDLAHDRQAEPSATPAAAGPAWIAAVEALEHPLLVFLA